MDTEASPRPRHGGDHPIAIFITSISAAIVVAGGFGIIIIDRKSTRLNSSH